MNTDIGKELHIKEYRLSEIHAKDEYDYRRIEKADDIFLKCEINIENEKAQFAFEIDNKKQVTQLSKEERLMKLKVLLDAGKFQTYWKKFDFSMHPDNLYYDMYGKVFVMYRDVCDLQRAVEPLKRLEEYKALVGCILSNQYRYEDYLEGGMSLLKKDKFLARIAEALDWEEVVHLLQEETERVITYKTEKIIEVERSSYTFKKNMTIFSFVLFVLVIFGCSYYLLWIRPYDKGVIQAQNAYLELNYTQVISSLEKIKLERLDNYQKYILATSYVKCENLTDEQKTNILAAVKLQGDEKVLDYWIHIGRLDVASAENIAQQLSNDQLLVYAYLKERYVVESDTELSGEEKTAKLANLDDKIQSLTQQEEAAEEKKDE